MANHIQLVVGDSGTSSADAEDVVKANASAWHDDHTAVRHRAMQEVAGRRWPRGATTDADWSGFTATIDAAAMRTECSNDKGKDVRLHLRCCPYEGAAAVTVLSSTAIGENIEGEFIVHHDNGLYGKWNVKGAGKGRSVEPVRQGS